MTTKKTPSSKKKEASAKKTTAAKKSPKASSAKSKKKEDVVETESREDKLKPFVSAPKAVVSTPPPVVAPSRPTPVAPPPPATPAAKPVPPAAPATPKATPPPYIAKPAPKRIFTPPPPIPSAAPVAKKAAAPSVLKPAISTEDTQQATEKKKIRFNEMMSVKDLAAAMDVKVTDVIKKLLTLGTPASINQRLEKEAATLVADGFGFELEFKSIYVDQQSDEPEEKDTVPRSPVVTVMGHVDHGKTSLLDAIRSAKVAAGEAGGITQHIGAYQVKTSRGVITFLDTPGHEAFTAMRARGAVATDIVILVVAADDSVMPQTVEAIDHARAADVPIVVAINKVDLPTANVQKVKQELAQHNLVAEDWGGKTVMVEVSAKTQKNIDKLLEMLSLEAELLELRANPDRPARGTVLEARLDPKRGVTATVLIQTGTLKIGDIVVCGLSFGRIRAMLDDHRNPLQLAGPSMPTEILGLAQVPQVGDQLAVVGSEREAREIAERRQTSMKDSATSKISHLSLESLHSKIEEGKLQDLPIIVKADVQGSLQAIQDSLGKMPTKSIQLRFVHMGIGNVNESDVLLAEAADAIIFGFNVKTEGSAETEAKKGGVDIRSYKIIYEMLADIKAAMEGLLKPEEVEVVKGRAQVKQMFPSTKLGAVAGCMVLEGKITRGFKARLVRDGQPLQAGSIATLRRFKDDVKEVEKGFECGLAIDGIKAYKPGDIIEIFVIEKRARRLEA